MKKIMPTLMLISFFSTTYAQNLETPTLSPYARVSQQIGLTEIKLEYSRPSAKGRVVFGELVPFNEVWRTGANASTKINLTEAAKIGGMPIDSGTYALYTIPGEEMWTIIIHGNTKLRSLAGDVYKQEDDVFRFQAKVEKTDRYSETFTLQFADLTTNSMNLQLSWANTIVNIPIEVEVDNKIAAQMTQMLKIPETIPDRTYFEAAQYYLTNNKDLNDALSWIDAALAKSPENPRYGLLKAKIEYAAGDKKLAMKTINSANSWAVKQNNANYTEQTALFRDYMIKNK